MTRLRRLTLTICAFHLGFGLVLQRRFLHLVTFGQFLAGNRFAEGKTTKLSSAWAGRHEEVLKGPFLRTVVVILNQSQGEMRRGMG